MFYLLKHLIAVFLYYWEDNDRNKMLIIFGNISVFFIDSRDVVAKNNMTTFDAIASFTYEFANVGNHASDSLDNRISDLYVLFSSNLLIHLLK